MCIYLSLSLLTDQSLPQLAVGLVCFAISQECQGLKCKQNKTVALVIRQTIQRNKCNPVNYKLKSVQVSIKTVLVLAFEIQDIHLDKMSRLGSD